MKRNVGEFDSYCRMVGGLTLFGFGIIKKSKPMIFLGSMKVAEAVTKWCPMLALMNISTSKCCNQAAEEATEE